MNGDKILLCNDLLQIINSTFRGAILKTFFMKKYLLILFIAASLCKTTESFGQVSVGDSLALVNIWDSCGGRYWQPGWILTNAVNTWDGVIVSGGRVTTLSMIGSIMTGTIPYSIGNLTALNHLDFTDNGLTGNIPSSIGNLSNLWVLHLGSNSLSGDIPASFSNLTFLSDIDLNGNGLTGSLAPLKNLSDLQWINLNSNAFTGQIPSEWGNASNLLSINLSYNQFSGSIPSSLGNLSNLDYFDLDANQLSGVVPASLDSFTNLSYLDISNNMFTFTGMEGLAHYDIYEAYIATYAPQDSIIPLHYNNAGVLSVSAGGTLSNNTYNWYNNGVLVATVTGDSTYHITEPGSYYVTVTNSVAIDLTLTSSTYTTPIAINIVPDHPHTQYANREYVGPDGWTNYYYDNNTPGDFTDDTLVLSLNLHGQNIGTIGDGTFSVKVVATAGAGSNTGIDLTNPLITNPSGFWVMNRYWLVTPTAEPVSNVGVRFYYNNQDLADVNGSYPTHDLTNQQLIFYKEIGGNPDPTTNLAGATKIISILNSNYASDTTWGYHQLSDTTQYAQFTVSSFSGGGGGGTGNDQALPIKLLSFTATKNGNKNLLQWTTAQEVNSNYFSVERSNDDVSFNSLGNVTARGNTAVATAYSFTDAKPNNGTNHYRLRMVNKDGSYSYSEIRSINDAMHFAVNIYPNPVKDNLALNFSSAVATNAQIEIINNEGKIMFTQKVSIGEGASAQSINVAVLSGGTYYLKCVSSEGESEVRFVKRD
jgi:hypothetical protein